MSNFCSFFYFVQYMHFVCQHETVMSCLFFFCDCMQTCSLFTVCVVVKKVQTICVWVPSSAMIQLIIPEERKK